MVLEYKIAAPMFETPVLITENDLWLHKFLVQMAGISWWETVVPNAFFSCAAAHVSHGSKGLISLQAEFSTW